MGINDYLIFSKKGKIIRMAESVSNTMNCSSNFTWPILKVSWTVNKMDDV